MGMNPVFFKSAAEFRKWLGKNHRTETELLVGYSKVGLKKAGISYSESVDEAICFGWIDGIRRSIDEESYCNRFTPRNPKSSWSAVNIRKVEELIKLGKMHPAGIDAFEKRTEAKSAIYSYENQPEKLDPELEIRFRENLKAWNFFKSQAPSYKKMMFYWVMSARQQTTQINRLHKLIAASEAELRIR